MDSGSNINDKIQERRRILLIEELLREDRKKYKGVKIPRDGMRQAIMLRRLLASRPARYATAEFLIVQNLYLRLESMKNAIMDCVFLPYEKDTMCLWQGDITTLDCDAIVNSAHPDLLGPFDLDFGGVDSDIHYLEGIQLRYECDRIRKAKKRELMAGEVAMTHAHNLPCSYILHAVAPEVHREATEDKLMLLGKCYTECLERAAENPNIKSIAFCCIGTGNNGFDKVAAAKTAVEYVQKYLKQNPQKFRVIFCVHNDQDLKIYKKIFYKPDWVDEFTGII